MNIFHTYSDIHNSYRHVYFHKHGTYYAIDSCLISDTVDIHLKNLATDGMFMYENSIGDENGTHPEYDFHNPECEIFSNSLEEHNYNSFYYGSSVQDIDIEQSCVENLYNYVNS